MLNAIVNLDLYRYEIHALIQAFYPEESVKVWLESDWESGRKTARQKTVEACDAEQDVPADCRAFLCVHYFPDRIELRLDAGAEGAQTLDEDVQTPGVRITQAPQARTLQAPEGINYTEKSRTCKTALKHAIYEMLSELTGRTLPWGELIGVRPTKIAMTRILEYMDAAGGTDTSENTADADAPEKTADAPTTAPDAPGKATYSPEKAVEYAAGYLMQEHLVSPGKAYLAANIAMRERQILSGIDYQNGYSLYIGIPFCPTTCLYCSFPSYSIEGFRDRVDEYLDALEKEIRAGAQMMQELGKKPDTVYIGGGTPTTLEPDQMDRLLTLVEECFVGGWQEFTVEAGRPDSITQEKLRVIKQHGITRISVNPQTMKEETLRLIGRRHSVQDVIDAFYLARAEGFDNINMDLILGLPEETEEDVARTISEIVRLSPDSLTVHSLALKRGSRMQEWILKNGWKSLRNADEAVRIAAEGAAAMGMEPYYLYRQKNISGNFENVGYAKSGKAGCYNILIMEEKQSILALGAGSVSKAVSNGTIIRSDNAKDIATYLQNIDEMIERKKRIFAE